MTDATEAATRPARVAMLLHKNPSFERVWADAAATHCDLTRVRICPDATGSATALPFLWQEPGAPRSFLLEPSEPSPRWAASWLGPLVRLARRRRITTRARRALQLLQDEQGPFDLVHGHFSASSQMVTASAARLGTPYVITEHSTSFSGRNPANQVSRRGLARSRRSCAAAAVVLPVSLELERAMRERGVEANFQVLPNPVDTSLFGPPDALPPSDTIELTCVARLAVVKGQDVLLDAVSQLRDRFPTLRLTLVGGGRQRQALEAKSGQLGLGAVVTFAGAQPPEVVAERLRRSHLFVLPSRWENLSVAALEACVTGLPVVTTRVGGLPEIEADGVTFVEPDDLRALVDGLAEVLGDLPDLATRQERAERARARYALEAVGARLEAVYQQVRQER